jgi:glutamate-1-semialdehyde 2,1-aminomutase
MPDTRLNSFARSKAAIVQAKQWLPGGVNSNFRLGIAPTPLVIGSADGAYLRDADGNMLIDYYLGMGPMILGHTPASISAAVRSQLERGILFAGQTEMEFEAAKLVCAAVPCAERVRFGSSGTEMVQAALRLARAVTGKQVILKFEGHYHGWLDNVLWSVAPRRETCGPPLRPNKVAGSAGQDADCGNRIDVLPWNDLDSLTSRLAKGDVAAVIMEPAMCNAGAIPPAPGYLEGARKATSAAGVLLIFDEVITGFRLGLGGAQEKFGVIPDLAVFGKAIASGFPVAALAGRARLMDSFESGGVVHGGTYNGHPVTMAATVATLRELSRQDVYRRIDLQGKRLMEGLREILLRHQIGANVQGFPGVFHVAFGANTEIRDFRGILEVDREKYVRFAVALLERGVRVLERGVWFLSAAHDERIIDATLVAAEAAAAVI